MPVQFKWVVLVKDADEAHPRFWGSCASLSDAREAATKYITSHAPGAVATVLEMREVITGKITVQMDVA